MVILIFNSVMSGVPVKSFYEEVFMKKFLCSFLIFAGLFVSSVFAQDPLAEASWWSFNLVTDILENPKSDYITGNTHFAPITNTFDNFQMRERFHSVWATKVNLGENPLFQYANLSVDIGAELTPIDFGPILCVTFMPLPFLYFNAGGMFCAGWPLMGIDSISVLNPDTKEWTVLTPFVNNYYELYASGTFQWDFGAIIPSDWAHVIITATYKVLYKGMTGMSKDDIWSWMGEPNMTNGLTYYQTYMLGYHFPKVDLDPVIEFQFEKETIDFLLDFTSRRSFAEPHSSMNDELYLTCTGREWYLRSFYQLETCFLVL